MITLPKRSYFSLSSISPKPSASWLGFNRIHRFLFQVNPNRISGTHKDSDEPGRLF